jgi:hypothetical protein
LLQIQPHDPQLSSSFTRSVSHPSSDSSLWGLVQLPQPELQFDVHKPPVHDVDATCMLLQLRPHAPQSDSEELMFVSHPSRAASSSLLQSA